MKKPATAAQMKTATKKIHPADAADREAILGAAYFTAYMRLSPSSSERSEHDTLSQAIAAAEKLQADRKAAGKPGRSMVYAVTKTDASVPVPPDMISAYRDGTIDIIGSRATAAGIVSTGEVAGVEQFSTTIGMEGAEQIRDEDMAAAGIDLAPAKAGDVPAPAAGGKRAQILAAAQAGNLPPEPDFSAETHKRFRARLAEIVAMAKAGDLAGLEAAEIKAISSSPKAIAKFRDLAVIALKARVGNGQGAA